MPRLALSCTFAAATLVRADWRTHGGSEFRTSSLSSRIADPSLGVAVWAHQVVPSSSSIATAPLLGSGGGERGSRLAVSDANCSVYFHDGFFSPISIWREPSCAAASVVVTSWDGGALNDRLVAAVPTGVASASLYAVESDAVVWGPVPLDLPVVAPPLVWGGRLAVTTGTNTLFLVNSTSGTELLRVTLEPPCGGASADVLTAPTLIDAEGNTFGVVSTRGCLYAISALNGAIVYASPFPGSTQPSFSAAPPAMDVPLSQLYSLSMDGMICCYSVGPGVVGGGGNCAGWALNSNGMSCVNLSPAHLMAPGGLAVSPPTLAFNGGAVFAVAVDGTLFSVGATNGVVYVAPPLPLGGSDDQQRVVTAPVLVIDGLGPHAHALILVSTSGIVLAVHVGDNDPLQADDDEADDDGHVTIGVAWSVALLPAVASTAAGGGGAASIDAAAAAVDGGRDRALPRESRWTRLSPWLSTPSTAAAIAGTVKGLGGTDHALIYSFSSSGGSTRERVDFSAAAPLVHSRLLVASPGVAARVEDGAILVPTTSGALFVLSRAHDTALLYSPAWIALVVIGITLLTVAGAVYTWRTAKTARAADGKGMKFRYMIRREFLFHLAGERARAGQAGSAATSPVSFSSPAAAAAASASSAQRSVLVPLLEEEDGDASAVSECSTSAATAGTAAPASSPNLSSSVFSHNPQAQLQHAFSLDSRKEATSKGLRSRAVTIEMRGTGT